MSEMKIASIAAMSQRREQTEANGKWSRLEQIPGKAKAELGLSDVQVNGLKRMLAEAREVYLEPDQIAAEPIREPPPNGIQRIDKDSIRKLEAEAEVVNDR